jgi:hypothetical protein
MNGERFGAAGVPKGSTDTWRESTMSFPWPVIDDDLVRDDALGIALRHLDLPADEEQYAELESFAGEAIMEDWRRGVRNKVVLANKAIGEIEDRHPLGNKLRRTS